MGSFSSHCIVKTNQRGFGYGSEAQGEKSRFDSLDKISQAEWEKKNKFKEVWRRVTFKKHLKEYKLVEVLQLGWKWCTESQEPWSFQSQGGQWYQLACFFQEHSEAHKFHNPIPTHSSEILRKVILSRQIRERSSRVECFKKKISMDSGGL